MRTITKHKVSANTLHAFMATFDVLLKRIEQTGEIIVGSRFVFDDTAGLFHGFRATVWTERKEKEGCEHA